MILIPDTLHPIVKIKDVSGLLRHTLASYLIMSGVDLLTVIKLLEYEKLIWPLVFAFKLRAQIQNGSNVG